ncbi:6-pyruvoyl-tetrahydropterin synthase-related protein [[Clostridium] fimetarium]|uniref:Uncharacterized membrane protein n=1 Tax=[Clostridium] fimetarium TaxID=99656 RepID=A0A1I0R6L1_9FIRM|nr:6-pyruvoyl-tetrahydropterin synthase-related protein [[Clostridium] fimetarium]SEW36212.1 Uncharacterized membrane protein [[Clostridium] fimetarium]
MGFCGYKYKFELYASHSNIINSGENIHFHNFTMALYINTTNLKLDDNFAIEKVVQDWLKPFQGQQLDNMELFVSKETTVEGIGNTFFEPLYSLIEKLGYELVKLDIYENPIRVYSVSRKLLDSSVNEISSVPLVCLPLIQIDEDEEVLIDYNNKFQKEAAATQEPLVEPLVEPLAEEILEEVTLEEITLEEISNHKNRLSPHKTSTYRANKSSVHKSNKIFTALKLILGFGCFVLLAMLTMYIVKISGRYPQGSDTFCHLYRADLILKNIGQGNWYPLYDSTWYNGVEIMRYWGPIPLYIIAGLEWIVQSTVLDAYVLFLGVLVLIGGCGWILWGYRYNRVGLSVFLGLIWFYMPENIRVVIYEGNLPRGVINALLPFFFYFFWRVIEDKKKNAIWPLMVVTALITLCHLGITIMLIATVAIFTVIYAKMNHCGKWALGAVLASISGVMLAGVWVVPALIGGAASGSSTNQVMKNFFESATVSLNPMIRLNGDALSFYFGLSIFIICLMGIVFGTKKVKPGFITVVILYLCTTKSIYTLFSKLPFSQFLWMIRFIPIALAVAMVSFIMWKQLRKWMIVLFGIMLLADCFASAQYLYYPKEDRIENVQADLDAKAETMILTEAKKITNQRMALLDLSKYGSFAPYYIAGVGKTVKYTFGAGWEGASTASNIVNLNAAVENGWYVYLFDRALELGNDTVLIPITCLKEKAKDMEKVINSAQISGYNLVKNNGSSLLFHKDTIEQFGVITQYKNIAIGDSASGIAMIFPSFEEGSKTNISDYTFEELCKYNTIYLSGFTYDDKAKAEELLLKLSKSGVQVYIDMNKVPEDRAKKQMELFGVNAQIITFTETYPEFQYKADTYKSLDFSADTPAWNTIYLNGLENVEGYCNMPEKNLPFIGTSQNENLHFIGLNIVYYLQTTKDLEIKNLVGSIFGMDEFSTPNRKVVPLSIKTDSNKITIYSEYNNVNTTLSSIDIFSSDNNYKTNNNLIVVDSGVTVIDIGYPHFKMGILVTAVGIILAIITYVLMLKMKEKKENDDNDEIKEEDDNDKN